MGIGTRIAFSQIGIVLVVALMALAGSLAVRETEASFARIEIANDQLAALARVAETANYLNEQLAEVMLIGDAEADELADAQRRIHGSLDHLAEISERELRLLAGSSEADTERLEIARVERLRDVVHAIERSTAAVLELRERDLEAAITRYRIEIENGFDLALEGLIEEAIADEQGELAHAEARMRLIWALMGPLVLAVAGVMVVVSLLASWSLHRAIVGPLAELVDKAGRLERGEGMARVTHAGPDEIGTLARRFNTMAGVLEGQRAELLAAKDSLAEEVRVRTADLAAANQRLRVEDRQRVQLLSEISHELRTPLTVIRGEAEIALRQRGPETAWRDSLARVIEVASDMGRLVDDLLALARGEIDTTPFEREPVDLGTLAVRTVRQLQPLAESRAVPIVYRPCDVGVTVEGDAQRLHQAVLALLDNALKYADRATAVVVTLGVDHRHAELVVENEGPGIAQDDLAAIFEPYVRGRGGEAVPGSGLGLAIARRIVLRHAGDITLASEPGKRTRAVLRLPLLAELGVAA